MSVAMGVVRGKLCVSERRGSDDNTSDHNETAGGPGPVLLSNLEWRTVLRLRELLRLVHSGVLLLLIPRVEGWRG